MVVYCECLDMAQIMHEAFTCDTFEDASKEVAKTPEGRSLKEGQHICKMSKNVLKPKFKFSAVVNCTLLTGILFIPRHKWRYGFDHSDMKLNNSYS